MNYFNQLKNRISEELTHKKRTLEINNFSAEQYALYLHFQEETPGSHLFVFPDSDKAESFLEMHQSNKKRRY